MEDRGLKWEEEFLHCNKIANVELILEFTESLHASNYFTATWRNKDVYKSGEFCAALPVNTDKLEVSHACSVPTTTTII